VKTRDIHQTVVLKAPVSAVYKSLTDQRQHSKITGSKAVFGRTAGSPFKVWGGAIHGVTLRLIPNKRIVQAWRSEDWPPDHYSIATFTFKKVRGGTKLVFDQSGVPASHHRDMVSGWKDYYWAPMKQLLEK
jgi:activator of HSP90 ATPase